MSTKIPCPSRRKLRVLSVAVAISVTFAQARAQDIAEMNNHTIDLFSRGSLPEALNASIEAVNNARKKGVTDLALGVALANEAEILRLSSRFAEAAPLFDEALRTYEDLHMTSQSYYATIWNNYGLLAYNQQQYPLAVDRYFTSLKFRLAVDSPEASELATTFNNIGDTKAAQGDRKGAINYYVKTKNLSQTTSPSRIYASLQIGQLEKDLGHFAEAESAYSSAICDMMTLPSPDNAKIARAQANIAVGMQLQHHYEEAEAEFGHALKSIEKLNGSQPQLAASIMSEKASLLRDMRQFDRARAMYGAALELLNPDISADLDDKASIENALGVLDVRTGLYGDAEASFRMALAKLKQANHESSYTAGAVSTNLGFLLADSGRLEEASHLLEDALNIFNQNGDQTDVNYGSLLSNLAIVYMQQQRLLAAEQLFGQSAKLSATVYGLASSDYASSLINRADFYNQIGRWQEAKSDATAAVEILDKIHPATASKANAYHRLGFSKLKLSDFQNAVKDLEHARTLAEALGDSGRSVQAGTLMDLALAYDLTGEDDKALQTYSAALDLNALLYGADSLAVAGVKFGLAIMYSARGNYEQSYRSFDDGNNIVVKRLLNDWSLSGLDASRSRYRPLGSESGFTSAIQAGWKTTLLTQADKTDFAIRSFETMQWAYIADSAYSLGLMAARGSVADEELQPKLKARQDVGFAVERLQKSLITMFASDDLQSEAIQKRKTEVQNELAALKAKATDLDKELSGTKNKFMALARPSAMSVIDAQAYLTGDEALVSFFPTPTYRGLEGQTFIWVVTKTTINLFSSPMDDKAVAQFVRTLKCGLDRTLWAHADNVCANLTEQAPDERAPLPFRMDLAYALYYQLFGQIERKRPPGAILAARGACLVMVGHG